MQKCCLPCALLEAAYSHHNMLAVLSISMRNLIMQEFSPCICMLVRFKMAQPESFTTGFLKDNQAGITELCSCYPTLTLYHLYASHKPFLKFCAKGNACVSREQLPPIGFLCKTRGIFRPTFSVLLANGLLALKAELFLQLLIFSFT